MKRFFTLSILLLHLWCGVVDSREIRVLIMENKESFVVRGSSHFDVIDKLTGSILFSSKEEIFYGRDGRLIRGSEVMDSPLIISSDSPIRLNGRRYRGKLEIRAGNKGLDVVNIIDIEEYLYGVIKWEISPAWSFEAVKAQAVIARTFAYANIGRHGKSGYDLCNRWHCQMYGGVESEDPRAQMAVDMTKGEVVTLNGRLINSIYHATCGGGTADASLVWNGNDLWYLKGVRCGFCGDSPHYYWSLCISVSDVERALQRNGLRIGRILSILPLTKDRFGRIGRLAIFHTNGILTIDGNRFRLVIGPDKVRSTIFTLEINSGSLFLNGRGWGHGVGMCQWGAKGMAEHGFDYREIIRHYYPDTTILRINDTQ